MREFLGPIPSQPFWLKEGVCRVYGEKTQPWSTLYLERDDRDLTHICWRHVLPRTLLYGKHLEIMKRLSK